MRRFPIRAALLALAGLAWLAGAPSWAQRTVPDFVVGGVFNTTPPALANFQIAPFQIDAAGNIKVNGAAGGFGGVAQGSATSGQTGPLVQCATTTAAPTYSNATTNPCSSDTSGNIRVTGGVAQGSTTAGEIGALIQAAVLAADPSYTTAQTSPVTLRLNGHLPVEVAPSALAVSGIASVVSGSAENNHVLKASAGNLYSVYATNLTASAGFLVVLNATSSPADGAITPLDCAPLPANGNASINYRQLPKVYSTGITAVVTSATTCFTKTTGVITAFISGDAQ